jgi:hypothetical protein
LLQCSNIRFTHPQEMDMGLQTIMNDAKARFDALSSRGSKSAKTSVEGCAKSTAS